MSQRAVLKIANLDDLEMMKLSRGRYLWTHPNSDKFPVLVAELCSYPQVVIHMITQTLEFATKFRKKEEGFSPEIIAASFLCISIRPCVVLVPWRPAVNMEMVKKACDYCYFLELDSVMNNWTLYWWKFNKKETKSISWNFDHKPVVLTKYKVANLPPLSTAYDFFQKIIYKKTI